MKWGEGGWWTEVKWTNLVLNNHQTIYTHKAAVRQDNKDHELYWAPLPIPPPFFFNNGHNESNTIGPDPLPYNSGTKHMVTMEADRLWLHGRRTVSCVWCEQLMQFPFGYATLSDGDVRVCVSWDSAWYWVRALREAIRITPPVLHKLTTYAPTTHTSNKGRFWAENKNTKKEKKKCVKREKKLESYLRRMEEKYFGYNPHQ